MTRLCFLVACLAITQFLLVQVTAISSGRELHVVVRQATLADPPSSADSSSEGEAKIHVAEAPENRRLGKHHSMDKSEVGAGVIIGGLITAIFAAVYCYIRVTKSRGDGDKQ